MAFLPAIPNAGPPDPPSLLSSAEFKRVFDELRENYQFVMVDLSALTPVMNLSTQLYLLLNRDGQPLTS
jgi:Mrp family chromosome partitioning ATPase